MKYTTKALHTKYPKSDTFGALRTPIYQNAAFEYASSQELEDVFTGKTAGHTYSRASNPTIEELENKIKSITSSKGVVATSSGMAAISNTFFALLKSGDNIITTNKLFGHTLSFFQNTLVDFGIDVRYVDICSQDSIKNAIDEKTKVIFFETISNPELIIPNIKMLSTIAKENNLVLIADTTMTPFYLFDSKKHGIDIDVLSATKYISAGGVAVGGIIIDNGNYDWSKFQNLEKFHTKFGINAFISKLKKQTFRNIGSCLSPQNAYMLSLGLETLALRADRTKDNTKEVAYFLNDHTKVKSVNYPLLKTNPYYDEAKEYFLFPGSILTFDLEDKQSAYKFMDKLELVRRSTNIQDNKSLIIAPYHTIYSEYTDEQKRSFGLREGTLRLSVGIEDIEDLIVDLSQALEDL
ncbi:aminotransferase class I/II-fold pyridoxal phosphate-dependent enzyme [Arcobacter sp. FWKO B]|uniref:aminotransferase class I/II-fold pyridoxal phosphate-dependent enzyme n=1 Tax=Arcobacter sp. FWKO B TaxID=2593672 RepID=UPI0018A5FF55|nr:aminotransferase class I/II-fold pyridoxal phosphate-dependent enzyme [Arcobacter sp. FWKO B]QOG11817.1 O-acetylhomoserine aminocarboxypropyltransferase/cysteine synthase [Arcobacter sp. FWKO B]